jgi:hypothetical protein
LEVSHILADIEGGFGVDPGRLMESGSIPKGYRRWTLSWIRDRTHTDSTGDGHVPTLTSETPQGSPLSPFVFAYYIAKITRPRMLIEPDRMRLLIIFLNDFSLMVASRGSTRSIAIELWEEITEESEALGMSFSAKKTKVFHVGGISSWTWRGLRCKH